MPEKRWGIGIATFQMISEPTRDPESQPRIELVRPSIGVWRQPEEVVHLRLPRRVEQRVASILLMLSSKLGPDLPFTRQEIADMAGTTTETAIRVMSRLKDRRIIRSLRGKTIILDETKLRLLSEGPPQV